MKNKLKYKYRFKTEQEFIKEYGSNYHYIVSWNLNGEMDYLFGSILEIEDINFEHLTSYFNYIYYDNYNYIQIPYTDNKNWFIFKEMLTINNIEPSYKPRKLIY